MGSVAAAAWTLAAVAVGCGTETADRAPDAGVEAADGEQEGEVSRSEPPGIGTWRAVEPGPLATRAEAKAVWTGTEILVVGGVAVEHYAPFADGAAYDPETASWRRIAPRPDPGRIMVAAWTESELFALGAKAGIEMENLTSAHLYDPGADRWRTTTPPPRGFNGPENAWWTGREVLIWEIGRGMLYDPTADTWRDIPAVGIAEVMVLGRAQWLAGPDLLAVQGAQTPPDGGPLRDALLLYDPATDQWRLAAAVPSPIPQFTLSYAAWVGTDLIFHPEPAAPVYAYNPAGDAWRELPRPAVARDGGTAYFSGVPLDDGRGLIRIGDQRHPFVITEPDGSWSYSPPLPGDQPFPGGPVVWTGSELWLWGRPDGAAATDPNAAWAWSPEA